MSKLEYASLIWHPVYICHSSDLEHIHRRFLKFVSYKTSGVYPGRGANLEDVMTSLRVGSLADRREHQSALFLVKLINNKIDCPYLLAKISFNIPRIAARSSVTFSIPRARTNALVGAPVSMMCRNANKYFKDLFV